MHFCQFFSESPSPSQYHRLGGASSYSPSSVVLTAASLLKALSTARNDQLAAKMNISRMCTSVREHQSMIRSLLCYTSKATQFVNIALVDKDSRKCVADNDRDKMI